MSNIKFFGDLNHGYYKPQPSGLNNRNTGGGVWYTPVPILYNITKSPKMNLSHYSLQLYC